MPPIRGSLTRIRSTAGRPFRWFAALDSESRAAAAGLALVAAGVGPVGPAAFVPGFILTAVGLRLVLPIAHPIVAIAAIMSAAVIAVAGMVFR